MTKVILIAVLQSMTFASGVVIPYFMGYWSTASDIFLFTAVYQFAILLFEIPTGLIASKFWEKNSIILWFLLTGIYYLTLNYTTTSEWFLVLQWLLWCSVAFLSGSLNTFLKYFSSTQWYSYIDLRKKYKIITLIIWIITTILGWFLSAHVTNIVFIIQALLFFVIIGIILSIPYNPEHKFIEKSYLWMIKKSISVLRGKDIFLPTIFIYSFLAIEAGVYVWFQTQYIWALDLPKEYIWIGLWLFVVASAIFTSYLPKQKRVLSRSFLTIIALCFILPLLSNVVYPSLLSLWLLYITQIIRPMDIPIEDKILNLVKDNTWSTVLSFVWFYERITFILITIWLEFFELLPMHMLILSSIMILSIYLFSRRSSSQNTIS